MDQPQTVDARQKKALEETRQLYGVSPCPDCHHFVDPHSTHQCPARVEYGN